MALTYVGESHGKSGKGTPSGAKAQYQRRASRGHALRSSKRGSVKAPGPGGSQSPPTGSGSSPPSTASPPLAPHHIHHHHQQQQQHQHHAPPKPASVPPRSSVRSKASSSASSHSHSRVKKLKNCCRTFTEFMFTQVGVGALVVAYTLMGASIFQHIETQIEDVSLAKVENQLNETVNHMWVLTNRYNVLNKDLWTSDINQALHIHEEKLVYYIQKYGYDQQTNAERWTFPSALMFALRWGWVYCPFGDQRLQSNLGQQGSPFLKDPTRHWNKVGMTKILPGTSGLKLLRTVVLGSSLVRKSIALLTWRSHFLWNDTPPTKVNILSNFETSSLWAPTVRMDPINMRSRPGKLFQPDISKAADLFFVAFTPQR